MPNQDNRKRKRRELPQERDQRDAYSVQEAADRIGVGRATLYAWWASSAGEDEGPPTIKIGRRRLVPREGLEAWLREHLTSEVA